MPKPAMKELPDRRLFIRGSDARVIMGSDEAALHRLWQEKRGEVEPRDLSRDLLVQLGSVTEDLNRRWFEQGSVHGCGGESGVAGVAIGACG
jgi:predicted phage-related endonuclease